MAKDDYSVTVLPGEDGDLPVAVPTYATEPAEEVEPGKAATSAIDALLEKGDDDEIQRAATWLRQIIYVDPRKLFYPNNPRKMLPPGEWPEEIRPAVKRISVSKGGEPIVEFHDPMSAMDRLAKILGWYQANAAELSPLEELMHTIPRDKLRLGLEVLTMLVAEPEAAAVAVAEDDGDDEIHMEHGQISRLVDDVD